MADREDGEKKTGRGRAGVSCLLVGAALAIGGPCVIGIVAAVAIPALISYVKRSKTTEARTNLSAMFHEASVYYQQDHFGPDGRVLHGCTVDPAVTPDIPGPQKTSLVGRWPEPFMDLGFTPSGPLYYRYEIVGGPAHCGIGPNEDVYTFRAYGDLDDDGVLSTFELAVGSDANGELIRPPAIDVVQELE